MIVAYLRANQRRYTARCGCTTARDENEDPYAEPCAAHRAALEPCWDCDDCGWEWVERYQRDELRICERHEAGWAAVGG